MSDYNLYLFFTFKASFLKVEKITVKLSENDVLKLPEPLSKYKQELLRSNFILALKVQNK